MDQKNNNTGLTIIIIACFAFLLGVAIAFAFRSVNNHNALVIREQIPQMTKKDQDSLLGKVDAKKLYQKINPGVVTVRAQIDGVEVQGSGAVLDKQGWIITNEHVIVGDPTQGAKHVAQRVFIDFADGTHAEATIHGQDPNSDLTLLKIDPKGLSLRPLTIRDSKSVIVGEPVATIGAPLPRWCKTLQLITPFKPTRQLIEVIQVAPCWMQMAI